MSPAEPVHGLCKAERLSRKTMIEKLFAGDSKSFSLFPLRVVYAAASPEDGAVVSLLVSVSKRRFKRAVKRNRVKRQIREAYRLQKQPLLDKLTEQGQGMVLAFIYLSDRLAPSEEIHLKMKMALDKLVEKVSC